MNWDRFFTVYWLVWIVVGFGVPEGIAIGSGHLERTLSENVWTLEGNGATFFRYFIAAFCLWLFLHMTFRWFR